MTNILIFLSNIHIYPYTEAAKRGIRDDQLVFSDVCGRDEHLQRGYLADLCLDTPEYNGHTTTADVLWAGTPLVTLKGDKMASRVSASLLQVSLNLRLMFKG